ncbi:MAG: catalase, partial [Rubrivivax sp.]
MPKAPTPPASASPKGTTASKTSSDAGPKAAARNTDSASSRAPSGDDGDLALKQAAETGAMAAAMPFNANKPGEHGFEAGVDPQPGITIEAPSRLPPASTLSERQTNDKVGTQAPEGRNATIAPLDRVRVDSSGQMLTTNQGVRIADNQNSLKAGPRGPVLLEDFILREKITHFDHERIPERIVHARGSAAHGFFECYDAITDL